MPAIRSPLQKTTFLTAMLLAVLGLSACSFIHVFESGAGPSESAYADGMLAPCPSQPNCVSTHVTDPEHTIVPFTYSKSLDAARDALRSEVLKLPRIKLVKEEREYLHFEARSRVIQAIDDVEFLFDDQNKVVQFRSSSRLGFSDWGENRKRMEQIRNGILGDI